MTEREEAGKPGTVSAIDRGCGRTMLSVSPPAVFEEQLMTRMKGTKLTMGE